MRRIVYLGGLGDDSSELSAHLRSRHDVGAVLADGPIETVELRAAVVIGAGSASFEMLRYLTEVLPVMVTPKWVDTLCQPISIRDVLRYLVAVIEEPGPLSGVLEIGGPDVVSYAEMMAVYAEQAGLNRRRLIPVPVLTPRLSSLWVGLVTPVPAQLARPLVDSLVNSVTVDDHRAESLFPFDRVPLAEAIHRAIGRTAVGDVPTKFDDASSPVWQAAATDPDWTGGTELTDVRTAIVPADPHVTWQAVCRIGGDTGWYTGKLLWKLRGLLDQLVGGPGLRRGRRHPDRLSVGEPVDFWRVEDIERGSAAGAARGDASSRRGLAQLVHGAGPRRHPAGADGPLPTSGAVGTRLLVRGGAVPSAGVPRAPRRHRTRRRPRRRR